MSQRRFALPTPPPAWEEAGDLDEPGPACFQLAPRGVTLPDLGDESSEDCLHLNVWAPSHHSAESLPVLVWIHGGLFVSGTANNFSGAALAARGGMVVVTVNYRLGPWGFIPPRCSPPGEGSIHPNLGLLDQVAALRWVQANIAQLGGDPRRVTIAGQGTGATCALALTSMPIAEHLFHQILLFSPQELDSPEQLDTTTPALADALSIDIRGLTEALRSLPNDELALAASTVIQAPPKRPLWRPHAFAAWVDGRVLPAHRETDELDGPGRPRPMLVSTCAEEVNLQAAVDPVWARACEAAVRSSMGQVAWNRMKALYESTFGEEHWRNSLLTDGLYRQPAIRLLERQAAAGGLGWMMTFDHHPEVPPLDRMGACHGSDLPYVWTDPNDSGASYFPGLNSHVDRQMAEILQAAIAGFVHTGRPDSDLSARWSPYNAKDRVVFRLSPASAFDRDPGAELRHSWGGLDLG